MSSFTVKVLNNYITLFKDLLTYTHNIKIKYQIQYIIQQIKCFSLYIRKCVSNNDTYVRYHIIFSHFINIIKQKYDKYMQSLLLPYSFIYNSYVYSECHNMSINNIRDNYNVLYKQLQLTNKL